PPPLRASLREGTLPGNSRVPGGRKAAFAQSVRAPAPTAQGMAGQNPPLEPLPGKNSRERLAELGRPVKPTPAELREQLELNLGPPAAETEQPQAAAAIPGAPRVPRGVSLTKERIIRGLKFGPVNPAGMSTATREDRHAIAALFRNPYFETFQWYLVKDQEVVQTFSISARSPDSTAAHVPNRLEFSHLTSYMLQSGADSYFMSHNHPSGEPMPSEPDVRTTRQIVEFLKVEMPDVRFLGHYVVDHDQFAVINSGGIVYMHALPAPLPKDSFLHPSGEIPPGLKIESVADLALLSQRYHRPGDHITVLFANARLKLNAVGEFDTTAPVEKLEKQIRELARQTGSLRAFAYYNVPTTHPQAAPVNAKLVELAGNLRVLTDAVTPFHPNGMRAAGIGLGPHRAPGKPGPLTIKKAGPGAKGIRYSLGGEVEGRGGETPTTEALAPGEEEASGAVPVAPARKKRKPESPESRQAKAMAGQPKAEPEVGKERTRPTPEDLANLDPKQQGLARELRVPGIMTRLVGSFFSKRSSEFNRGHWRNLSKIWDKVPSVESMVSLAKVGFEGRRWYQMAKKVFEAAIPNEGDRWRFTGVAAATSPTKSVVDNLRISLGVWRAWNAAGRPTSEEKILDAVWAYRNADGTPTGKGPGGRITKGPGVYRDFSKPIYLPADLNNTIHVLSSSTQEEALRKMSQEDDATETAEKTEAAAELESTGKPSKKRASPKVTPFFRALLGQLDAVVNDTWMARLFGLGTTIGSPNPNLIATALTKEVARRLGAEPAEVQAALWAIVRVLGDRIMNNLDREELNRSQLSAIMSETVTPEMMMPGDDLATMLVEGYRTKAGKYDDFPERAKKLGFDVEAARKVLNEEKERARTEAFPGRRPGRVRRGGREVGINPRGSLGENYSREVGRRIERGYLADRPGVAALRPSLGGRVLTEPPSIVTPTMASPAAMAREEGRQRQA